jgi:hypothetical protein
MVVFERKWRELWHEGDPPLLEGLGIELDAAPHVGFALGNVFTYGGTGITLRLGNDLPADYGPPRIRPRMPGSDFFKPSKGFGWYLFTGVEGRIMLRNIFLDGNTFVDSHSVTREPLVGDFQLGVALTALGMRGAFTYVVRSPEFTAQSRADSFGAVTFSARL